LKVFWTVGLTVFEEAAEGMILLISVDGGVLVVSESESW